MLTNKSSGVKGINNSEGSSAGWGLNTVAMAASNGFARAYANSSHSLSVSVIAGEGTEMEGDYDYSAAVFAADESGDTAAVQEASTDLAEAATAAAAARPSAG